MKTQILCTVLALGFWSCQPDEAAGPAPGKVAFDFPEGVEFSRDRPAEAELYPLEGETEAQWRPDHRCAAPACGLVVPAVDRRLRERARLSCEVESACVACCLEGDLLYAMIRVEPPQNCFPFLTERPYVPQSYKATKK